MEELASDLSDKIHVLSGLPGAGKSSTLIRHINHYKEQQRTVYLVLCNESRILNSRPSVVNNRIMNSRVPLLKAKVTHFISKAEAIDLLANCNKDILLAFDEAQHFGLEIVPHWIEAAKRGVELFISSITPYQLELLKKHSINEIIITMKCQECSENNAEFFIKLPFEDKTLSLCEPCHSARVEEERINLLARLQEQNPYPGEKHIYQPVDIEGIEDWKVIRHDSSQRIGLMTDILKQLPFYQQKEKTYLDMGCNTGYFCHRMAQLGFASEGVDVVKCDIEVAKILDAYFYHDWNTFIYKDAHDYLVDTRDKLFDVTSSFSVFQWIMIQKSVDIGTHCAELLFDKTRHICFFEMGYTKEAHYKDRLQTNIDRDWVQNIMDKKGNFSEIRLLHEGSEGLKRDIFVGIK